MKFKVGDKVILNKEIKNFRYNRAGVSYEEIGTIEKIDADIYTVNFPSLNCWFGEEKELKKVEYTYEDLKKSPIGTKITFENGEVFVKNGKDKFESPSAYAYIDNLKNLEHYTLGKIIKIEESEYKTVYEYKPEILDETEKRYLRGVIRPFRDKVKYIKKYFSRTVGKEYLQVKLKEDRPMNLPYFEVNAMYKEMKKEKEYILKELGL